MKIEILCTNAQMNELIQTNKTVTHALYDVWSTGGNNVVECGDCTACCRSYAEVIGVEVCKLTKKCLKLKSDKCSVYENRPKTCREYTCLANSLAGIINEDIAKNHGRIFDFTIEDENDFFYAYIMAMCRLALAEDGRMVNADAAAAVICVFAKSFFATQNKNLKMMEALRLLYRMFKNCSLKKTNKHLWDFLGAVCLHEDKNITTPFMEHVKKIEEKGNIIFSIQHRGLPILRS